MQQQEIRSKEFSKLKVDWQNDRTSIFMTGQRDSHMFPRNILEQSSPRLVDSNSLANSKLDETIDVFQAA